MSWCLRYSALRCGEMSRRCYAREGAARDMTPKRLRSLARELAMGLPRLPQPWSIEALCTDLARVRDRSLTLHSVDTPAFPSGMWYDDGARDRIFYRSSAAGYYRDHIILHEICHMIAGHGMAVQNFADAGTPGTNACDNEEEELAEFFATLVLKRAGQQRPKGTSAVERRADELLGATAD